MQIIRRYLDRHDVHFVCIYWDLTQLEWDSVECIPPPVKPNPI